MVHRIVELLQTEERYERQRLVRWVLFIVKILILLFTLLSISMWQRIGNLSPEVLRCALIVSSCFVGGDLFFTLRDELRSKHAYQRQVAALTAGLQRVREEHGSAA